MMAGVFQIIFGVLRLGRSITLAIENAIQEGIDAGRQVIVVGAAGKVKRRLEKLGIAGLIPEPHWMSDRLTALQEGLAMVREKQGYNYDGTDKPFPSFS